MFYELDNLYLLSTKFNREAYNKLYSWFVDTGTIIALGNAKTFNVVDLNIEDTRLQLSELFIIVVRSFSVGVVPFEQYSLFLIRKRIASLMANNSSYGNEYIISLDNVDEEGNKLIDLIESEDYHSMHKTIHKSEYKQMFASKKVRNYKINGNLHKVYALREQGYKRHEIMEKLSITEGQYRYIIRLIMNIEIGNLKIDLKWFCVNILTSRYLYERM